MCGSTWCIFVSGNFEGTSGVTLRRAFGENIETGRGGGEIALDWDSLHRTLKRQFLPPYCVTSKRLVIRTINELVDYFWDFDDNRQRQHWDDYAFRALYRRCVQVLKKS